MRHALGASHSRAGLVAAGAAALLCSTVAWASLPPSVGAPSGEQREWQALGIAPLSAGGRTGARMAPTDAAAPIELAPVRATPFVVAKPPRPSKAAVAVAAGPLRIRGQVGDGLYWSLRAAGAAPSVAAEYLAALASEMDVGEVGPADAFDLVLGKDRALLYAGLDRAANSDLQLVRWRANGNVTWIDAASVGKPQASSDTMAWPVAGRITSAFGYRYHPILRFSRFHAGIDFGAGWGSPIVAAADGQVAAAGWAGGYGRQVRIAHGAGVVTSYSHMSEIVASPGSYVRRGQLIGYVGSSGLSTGPHLHYEVVKDGTPVNPLRIRFAGAPIVDTRLAEAVKAQLTALLAVGRKSA